MLVNCVPVHELERTVEALRAQTSLPIGCYPNLGHSAGPSWEFDRDTGPQEFAQPRDVLGRRRRAHHRRLLRA